ncbi:U-box domain-containing protein 21-like [Diospyros lotus]|uniref:U-box domain-containing protein 21-like n=1 Tax=Diospyros lotus TaxID=55363 RepID=UPI002256C0D2|nr:U-box domain-containing protein 21-like [Diospyros lotus]
MISSWRRRRAARRAPKTDGGEAEMVVPTHFRCPISLDLMRDPVTLSTGMTYDRENIEKWVEAGNFTCPITNQPLRSLEPVPNHAIRKMIQDWCVENHSERIPTPKIPVTSSEAAEIMGNLLSAARRDGEDGECLNLAAKIKSLAKESERNRRCMARNGASSALSETFAAFSDRNTAVLEETLSALALMFPLDEEAKYHLGLTPSLNQLVWFLKNGDLSGRRNATLVLKEIVSSDLEKVDSLMEIEGATETLFKLIKEPISPTATKASLTIIYLMVSSSSSLSSSRTNFVAMGMVPLVLELIVDSERSICERGLGVLDGLCSCDQGREEAYSHALTVPVLVKKLLRVSDVATQFSVSVLWKLGKEERIVVEALEVGAFQKLLLLLQVGCGEKTKQKASELLRMLNVHRVRVECIESMDFKHLKRPH